MPTASKIISLLACVWLAACTTVKAVPTEYKKPKLQIVQGELDLCDVSWQVLEINGELFFAVDAKNYTCLSLNLEQIQAKINEQRLIIKSQQDYYLN